MRAIKPVSAIVLGFSALWTGSAQAQDGQAAAARSLPGPDSEWQTLGYFPPNQVMLIRTPATGPAELREVEVLFLYSPLEQGMDHLDNKYSVNCSAATLRDDGGTVWIGKKYLGLAPSDTDGQFQASPPESIHAAITAFACGTIPDLGPKLKLEPATVYALDYLRKQQH